MNCIKKKIKENGLTGIYVSEQVGCSETDLSNYIAELRRPNHSRLLKLTHVLRCKITDLYPNAKKRIYWDLF